MKRIAALLTALCLLLVQALAETTIDPKEARNITLTEAGENETPDGISPTTGRTLSKLYVPEGYAGLAATGRYLPMLVQSAMTAAAWATARRGAWRVRISSTKRR